MIQIILLLLVVFCLAFAGVFLTACTALDVYHSNQLTFETLVKLICGVSAFFLAFLCFLIVIE